MPCACSLTAVQRIRPAFTLTELLVAIAILLVLAGLLLPLINTVRNQARQTVCAGNLRQVSMVFNAYRNDHQAWPVASGTFAMVYPHSVAHTSAPDLATTFADYADGQTSIFYCPANAQRRTPKTHWPTAALMQYAMTYQAMMWVDPARFLVPRPNYRDGSATQLMFSDMLPTTDAARTKPAVWNHDYGNGVAGMNLCYGDGRVVWAAASGTWTCWFRDSSNNFYWWALGW